jgi:adenine phosphoribosyltransferase
LDARGLVLGPPIALQLQKPFVMIRKQGKMPNTISTTGYQTEYGSRSGLTIQHNRIQKGSRVLIIDDLVATGGTLANSISLIEKLGGIVVECACVVELKMFINPSESSGLPNRTKLFQQYGIDHVPIWGLISEDLLVNNAAPLPDNYKDDGEEH